MNVKKWLTITQNGSARITSSKPNLKWDEISVFLETAIPDALFRKPRLEARIDIPKEAAGPDSMSASVVENIKEAIETATGLTFHINVIREESDEERKMEGQV